MSSFNNLAVSLAVSTLKLTLPAFLVTNLEIQGRTHHFGLLPAFSENLRGRGLLDGRVAIGRGEVRRGSIEELRVRTMILRVLDLGSQLCHVVLS
jgi:hypothetical protein